MRYLDIHNSKMPALGYGTWQLDGKDCVNAVQRALEIGYRHIDTAQIYGNEAEIGEAISRNIKREEIFLTTKLWTTNFTAPLVESSLNESLQKLRTDYVDLLLMHWPNPQVPLAETLNAMIAQMKKGKVRAIGVSNFPVAWMKKAIEELKAPIACNQVEYHVTLSQAPVLQYAKAYDVVVTAYSPLARGRILKDDVLASIGKKYNKTASQVALRWLIEQNVAAIPKAASEKNARSNFNIFDFALSAEDMKAINALDKTNRTINPDFAQKWDVI